MAIIDNLVGFYSLEDDAASSTVTDDHSNGYDQTLTNDQNNYTSEQSVAAKVGDGFDLDGTNDFSSTGSAGGVTTTVSMQAWVQPDVNNVEQVLVYVGDGVETGGGRDHHILGITAAGKAFIETSRGSSGARAVGGTTLLTDGTWYHIFGVCRAPNDREIYVDAVSDGTDASTESLSGTQTDWSIGALPSGNSPYDGIIDEVGVWSVGKSESDISDLYNSGAGLAYPFAAGDKDVPVSAESLTLAAPAPTVVIDATEVATAEALTLASPAPVPAVSALPTAEALTLAIAAPTIVIDNQIVPAARALTLAAPAPAVEVRFLANVGDPAIGLGGFPIQKIVSALPAAQALTLAAPAPAVDTSGGVTVQPAAQALTLAGPAPTVQIDATPLPAAQGLTLATPAPAVKIDASVTPAAQALTLASPAPTIAIDATVAPAAMSLTLASLAPAGEVTFVPAAQAITLGTPAPSVRIDSTFGASVQSLTLAAPGPTISTGVSMGAAFLLINRTKK